jgi:hypothetical protein
MSATTLAPTPTKRTESLLIEKWDIHDLINNTVDKRFISKKEIREKYEN